MAMPMSEGEPVRPGQPLFAMDQIQLQASVNADAAEAADLSRLLWVRCRQASEALQAADILLRDRNFPLVVLDLKLNPSTQLRRIPGTVWHRFGRLLEQQRTALALCRDGELSYEEIASVLGTSLQATKSLIHRARETLKGRLKPYLGSGEWQADPSTASPRSVSPNSPER
jgi:multidrug efflux pump subunit AcrA (membrane-fusion protein)